MISASDCAPGDAARRRTTRCSAASARADRRSPACTARRRPPCATPHEIIASHGDVADGSATRDRASASAIANSARGGAPPVRGAGATRDRRTGSRRHRAPAAAATGTAPTSSCVMPNSRTRYFAPHVVTNPSSGAAAKIANSARIIIGSRSSSPNDGARRADSARAARSSCGANAGAPGHHDPQRDPEQPDERGAEERDPPAAERVERARERRHDHRRRSTLPVNSTPKPRGGRRGGSTRCIVCAAPGKLGPSATPSAIRSANSTPKPGASAWSAATDGPHEHRPDEAAPRADRDRSTSPRAASRRGTRARTPTSASRTGSRRCRAPWSPPARGPRASRDRCS